MLPQEVIRHKRDGQKLTKDEIDFFIKGITDWSVSECQIAAFAMAVYLRGMSDDEIIHLTQAMTAYGEILNWENQNLNGPVLDKYSTGGIGDKISLILAPMIAACGGYVPMISGRGQGYTGGTLDKLDSIPGYTTLPSSDLFVKVTKEVGCAIIGQTGDLVPADKRLYFIRDITATVESIPLITASILSKKLSAGLDALVMDVKFGNGAFMKNIQEAEDFAKILLNVASRVGLPSTAVLTDMNQILGKTVGNALEVDEAIDFLTGRYRNQRLYTIVMILCSQALMLKGLAKNQEDAHLKLQNVLDSGKAAELFAKMIHALGGPADLVENVWKYLPKAPVIKAVYATNDGYVSAIDTKGVGSTVTLLGGQRKLPDQRLDYAVGISDFVQIGDAVGKDKPIAVIHANDESSFIEARNKLLDCVQISNTSVRENSVIYKTVTA